MLKKIILATALSSVFMNNPLNAVIFGDNVGDVKEESMRAAQQHPMGPIVGLIYLDVSETKTMLATAFAISPGLLVTSAHCFDGNFSRGAFSTSMRAEDKNGIIRVFKPDDVVVWDGYKKLCAEIKQNPLIEAKMFLRSFDLAVIKLNNPLPNNLTYPKIFTDLDGLRKFNDNQLVSISYGSFGYSGKKSEEKFFKHLSYHNLSFSINNTLTDIIQVYHNDLISFKLEKGFNRLQAVFNIGDSGAPSFVNIKNVWYVVGAVSGFNLFNSVYRDEITLLAPHIDWIKSHMKAAPVAQLTFEPQPKKPATPLKGGFLSSKEKPLGAYAQAWKDIKATGVKPDLNRND